MYRVAIATLVLCLAGCVSRLDAPYASSSEAGEELICETFKETGSRIKRKRICLTADEWEARKAADRETVERAQRIGTIDPI